MSKNKKISLFNWFKIKKEQKEINKDSKNIIKKELTSNISNCIQSENKKNIKVFNNISNYILRKPKKDSFNHLKFTTKSSRKDNEFTIENKKLDNSLKESILSDSKKIGFFKTLKLKLDKTRKNIGLSIKKLFFKKSIDQTIFESIENKLLMADLGIGTTTNIINLLKKNIEVKQLSDSGDVYLLLKQIMHNILKKVEIPLKVKNYKPFVMLVVGSNGVGKTTTIGKLAKRYKNEGKSVMLAAGDTFRAGAIEQLLLWGEKSMTSVISQHPGADSAAVIFDAIESAKSKRIDVLIADTAGRLQNKSYLMEELKKIIRVMKKLGDSFPHEIMLVIDATSGQNVMQQIKLFHKDLGVTGITLTKLDGTAKGGVIFSIADKFSIPIRYIGIGEQTDDLNVFNSAEFIKVIFSNTTD